jgi:predicted RNase H-like nuclease (RuvC/YqgF family)
LDAIRKLKEEIENLESRVEASKSEIFGLTKKNSYYKSKAEEQENLNN